jgi:hypothetical protein
MKQPFMQQQQQQQQQQQVFPQQAVACCGSCNTPLSGSAFCTNCGAQARA